MARTKGATSSDETAAQANARLVAVVQELSLARDLETIMRIVRKAARDLTGADGATFVLRDGNRCHYADEDAIAPLWKGKRFPMEDCISGWVMLHREPTVIPDIYKDSRIPADAYRPTFVKSLAMVPIRTREPVGAIGNYWARFNVPSAATVRILQALADSTSIAMENVNLLAELERRVADRTAQLEQLVAEMEGFSYSVTHDLRAPLRAMIGFARILEEDHGTALPPDALDYVRRIGRAGGRMGELIDGLLMLNRVSRERITITSVDVTGLARELARDIGDSDPDRKAQWVIAPDLTVRGDFRLVRALLDNLMRNAWKFTRPRTETRIEVGRTGEGGREAIFVRDNGVGFPQEKAHKLFLPFQRLHAVSEFEGTGVGLATVQKIVQRHGGRVSASGKEDEGATFIFSLEAAPTGHPKVGEVGR